MTHVIHEETENGLAAYAPYVNEMNLWLKHVDTVEVVAPLQASNAKKQTLSTAYKHRSISLSQIPEFSLVGIRNGFKTLIKLPKVAYKIWRSCKKADHIHLRCPGNVGLVGCVVQIFFPSKTKTAKYAGNWDPKSKQPWSYRLQKRILSNTFLTKNMKVLAYGDWPNQTKNVLPFFTATYSEIEKTAISLRPLNDTVRFMFVGTLSVGKRPVLAAEIIARLHKEGHQVRMDVYGEGEMRDDLMQFIQLNNLEEVIMLHGNRSKEEVSKAYKNAHFVFLLSRSEGWPKAIAEAMFWGAVPVATEVSCVPYMLDNGNRGILIAPNISAAIEEITQLFNKKERYLQMAEAAMQWSRQYTLEKFETEIKKLL
ncbi:glycosyltransferase family 4 protein [Sungkyunkwania multivorans]|uniref:Glycosyltransferase family 4 protein n=1 Tax=Sungkyunkwania multivorans TaxID=1173618 RepID=A0ABW3D2Q8_9FLAO